MQWHHQRSRINPSSILEGKHSTDLRRVTQLGRYPLRTVLSSYQISRRVTSMVLVDNLLNREYQVLPGYPKPGIIAMGRLSFTF